MANYINSSVLGYELGCQAESSFLINTYSWLPYESAQLV